MGLPSLVFQFAKSAAPVIKKAAPVLIAVATSDNFQPQLKKIAEAAGDGIASAFRGAGRGIGQIGESGGQLASAGLNIVTASAHRIASWLEPKAKP